MTYVRNQTYWLEVPEAVLAQNSWAATEKYIVTTYSDMLTADRIMFVNPDGKMTNTHQPPNDEKCDFYIVVPSPGFGAAGAEVAPLLKIATPLLKSKLQQNQNQIVVTRGGRPSQPSQEESVP